MWWNMLLEYHISVTIYFCKSVKLANLKVSSGKRGGELGMGWMHDITFALREWNLEVAWTIPTGLLNLRA